MKMDKELFRAFARNRKKVGVPLIPDKDLSKAENKIIEEVSKEKELK